MAVSSSPDATSTEGSSSPASILNVSRTQAAPPATKKRVRRQQVELKYLRELAGQLELRLEQLKQRRLSGAPSPDNNGSLSCSPQYSQKGPVSVWESIADRQFKERSRVEKQNEELKQTLRVQSSIAQTLQSRTQKAVGGEHQTELAMVHLQSEGSHFWDLASGDEEAIFADLLALVMRIRLELQRRQVEDPRSVLPFATWGISFGDLCVRPDTGAGLMMETHARSLLPFNVKTTAAACWRMFSLTPMSDEGSFEDKSTVKDDLVARSFTCSSTHFGEKIHVRGKNTCRKYVDEDGCVTIVFAGRTGPATASAPCQEVQLQKTGWIKVRHLRSLDADQHSSAMLEMHSEMLPRFRADVVDQDRQAREVLDWVSKSYQLIDNWFRQTLSEILVEEDWKAFQDGKNAMSVC